MAFWIDVICDQCASVSDEPYQTRQRAWQEAVRDGWRKRDTLHICPRCLEQSTDSDTSDAPI